METSLTRCLPFLNFALATRDVKHFTSFRLVFKDRILPRTQSREWNDRTKGEKQICCSCCCSYNYYYYYIFCNIFYVASDTDRHTQIEKSNRLFHTYSQYFCNSPFLRFVLKVYFCTLRNEMQVYEYTLFMTIMRETNVLQFRKSMYCLLHI